MNVVKTINRQYQAIVDHAASLFAGMQMPTKGWIVTARKALGMSGAQLARRLGVSRAAVSQAEKKELSGGVSLKHMQDIAEALGCRFVYAIVPEDSVKDVILTQAQRKATEVVRRASAQMALEEQSLPPEKNKQEILYLRDSLAHEMPSDLWDEK